MKVKNINVVPETLDQKIIPEIEDQIGKIKTINKEFIIKNTDRTVGTRISHYLYKKYGNEQIRKRFSNT